MSNQVECTNVQLSIDSFEDSNLKLKNRGTWGINDIVIRIYTDEEITTKYAVEDYLLRSKILPGQTFTVTIEGNLNKLEFIPIINIDESKIGCENKIIIWEPTP
jgi:hypothetical protein